MADYDYDYVQESQALSLLIRIMSKRRTWVFLFVAVYTILLYSSWNILKSLLSWYESTSSNSYGWPAIYVSVVLGLIFGLLSMVLVLLTFCGKPRKALVVEGKKLTAEITGFVVKVLIKEGNVVAAVCAVLGYFALVRKSKEEGLSKNL